MKYSSDRLVSEKVTVNGLDFDELKVVKPKTSGPMAGFLFNKARRDIG